MNSTDDPLQAARDAGFDLDLIDTNLALSAEERLRQHDEALEFMCELQRARETTDAKLHATSATTR
jgi:hypothetical protein